MMDFAPSFPLSVAMERRMIVKGTMEMIRVGTNLIIDVTPRLLSVFVSMTVTGAMGSQRRVVS